MNPSSYEVVFTSNTPKEIEKTYNEVISQNGTFEELEKALSQYIESAPSVIRYLYARYHYDNGNFADASTIITDVLNNLDERNDYVIAFARGNLSIIYGLAGEIYACNNQIDDAKEALEDYQLCVSRLKGLEVNEPLLSFRRYNEYSLSDLINNEITVCSPRVMNDPYDTLLFKWGEYIKDVNAKPHTKLLCDSFESYRIRCFSSLTSLDGNDMLSNILMWSHYADQHYGFCIQYKFSDEFWKATEERRTVRFHKISYQDKGRKLDLTKKSINSQIALCTKHYLWEYENEVRLIAYEPDVNSGAYHTIPLDSDSRIEKVYFGYRCPQKHIDTIKKILSNQSSIKFYQMRSYPEDIFNLQYEEL